MFNFVSCFATLGVPSPVWGVLNAHTGLPCHITLHPAFKELKLVSMFYPKGKDNYCMF